MGVKNGPEGSSRRPGTGKLIKDLACAGGVSGAFLERKHTEPGSTAAMTGRRGRPPGRAMTGGRGRQRL
eukprot:667047-Pelagomonas_calceolata.AAC.1